MPKSDLELLTSPEVAMLLRVSVKTLRKWHQAGTGPKGTKLGRNVVYERKDVLDWWSDRRSGD